MRITHFLPQDALLKPLIAGIYLLERDADEPATQYRAFPGIHHFVTINRSAVFQLSGAHIFLRHHQAAGPSALLVANFDAPRTWSYDGPAYEWNICFQPLALNSFFKNGVLPLETGVSEIKLVDGFLKDLYAMNDPAAQLRAIEGYWLSQLQSFDHPFLPVVIKEMQTACNSPLNFSEMAARFCVSRTTFHSDFRRFIGTSPARFEKIARFRNALSAYRDTETAASLSLVSAKAAYFDQPHMVRDFRSLTGHPPKDFYRRVAEFPNGAINWIFA